MPQQFSDHNIDKTFREKLSGLRVEPRSRVWYRVSAGLDREAALLAHKKRRVIGVLIGVFILTGIILTAVLDPVATQKKISNTTGKIYSGNSAHEKNNRSSTINLNVKSLKTKIQEKPINSVGKFDFAEDIIAGTEISNFKNQIEIISNKITFSKYILSGLIFPLHILENKLSQSDNEKLNLIVNPVSANDKKLTKQDCNCGERFYTGANFRLNKTSFADTTTSQNLNYIDKFQIQKGFSVYAGYNITKNISAELGWNLFSNEGQSYGYTSLSRKPGSNPTRKDYEIALRYTQIPVKIRWNINSWSGLLNTQIAYSLAVGVMYGRLLKSGFTVNEFDISSHIKKSEIAAVGNLGVDIRILRRISFHSGIEVSFSNNIFVEDKKISPFTAPHNLIIGATTGLKYNFCH